MNVPRDICKVLIDEQGLTNEVLPKEWHLYASKDKREDVSSENTMSLIDGLVLLANSDKLLERMQKMDIQCVLSQLKMPKEKEWEDACVRLTVLENQLAAKIEEIP